MLPRGNNQQTRRHDKTAHESPRTNGYVVYQNHCIVGNSHNRNWNGTSWNKPIASGSMNFSKHSKIHIGVKWSIFIWPLFCVLTCNIAWSSEQLNTWSNRDWEVLRAWVLDNINSTRPFPHVVSHQSTFQSAKILSPCLCQNWNYSFLCVTCQNIHK